MKHLRSLIVLLATLTCCGTLHPPESLATSSASLVRDISAETVALVRRDADGDVGPFCTGVWVGPSTILTAAHCAVEDETTLETIAYIVQGEVTGHYKEPSGWHYAKVAKLDTERDLALLTALHAPQHATAHLAEIAPVAGDSLHFIGQAGGYYWTYMRGTMGQTWKTLYASRNSGPWMQVAAPIAHGMSGGGAFDEVGRLVGICSAISARTPNVGFYVHLDTLRTFVGTFDKS